MGLTDKDLFNNSRSGISMAVFDEIKEGLGEAIYFEKGNFNIETTRLTLEPDAKFGAQVIRKSRV